ncbi:uncharacterized protein LOC131249580 [Magnolia sinica]|uniref:uncharacterized protein LOC131249580 n=1 Tax=Magnolia sinica TaxID=86752 RepID=UPI00265A4780|nr:uncharacterized protein LOC131249580 [Magnolia sinica]
MAPPLATTANLPSSSTARRYINPESNIPHPDLPETSNFNTRQVPVPFDDAAFTNAAMLEYTDSLSESIEIAVEQTFKDKLAFGIGELENGSSWNWFLTYLSNAIRSLEDLVIISDRHKGLLKEVTHVFPRAIHGYCAYHIYRNLVDIFKDKSLEMYFWRTVKTCRVAEFKKLMHDIEMANPVVHAWLTEIGYEKWASSHFPGKRFNLVTINIFECVNALFKEAREYPVTKLIEGVRLKIQELFYKRRESTASFIGPLTAWAEQQLKDLMQKA